VTLGLDDALAVAGLCLQVAVAARRVHSVMIIPVEGLTPRDPDSRSRASRSQQANIIPAAAKQQTIPQNITMLMKSEALAARQVVIDC